MAIWWDIEGDPELLAILKKWAEDTSNPTPSPTMSFEQVQDAVESWEQDPEIKPLDILYWNGTIPIPHEPSERVRQVLINLYRWYNPQ